MKLTLLLLFVTALTGIAADSYSQSTKLTLKLENVRIEDLLGKIEDQSQFRFFYNEEINLDRKVSIDVSTETIANILEKIFADKGIHYEIIGRQIILSNEIYSNNVSGQQQKTVSGKVTDTSGSSLPGVSVVIKGTTKGVITGANGNYTLSNVPSDATLVFSFVGMKMQEVAAAGKTSINVVMNEETIGIEEVVAVGYGTQKKANLTGAVASISKVELENKPMPNVGEVLRGVSPNLNIDLGVWGGEPGSKLNINIRGLGSISGSSSPLILVDGVEMNINNLDPGNIESVSVLKDASASAIYGSRAPFGVILITTKKGTKDGTVQIQYNNNMIMGSPLGVAHMYNSLIFATAYNQAALNAGSPPTFSNEQMERIKGWIAGSYKTEYDPNAPPNSIWSGRRVGNGNWDWPYIYLKSQKFDQRHNINLSGGTEKTQYYISLGYYDQNGFYAVGYDKYKRFDVLSNVTSQVNKWLKFNVSTKFSKTHTDYPLGITTVERRYFFTNIYGFGPNTPRYNINGSSANPMLRSIESSGRDKNDNNDLLITAGTEIEPAKGWKTNVSYSYNITEVNGTVNPKPIMVELGTGAFGNVGKPSAAFESTFSHSPYSLFSAVTSFEKTLGHHYFKVLGGYEQEERNYSYLYARGESLITEAVPSLSTALGTKTVNDSKYAWATQGIFGRINYNYKEKYLLEVSGRQNGSSKFAPGSRWGFFPSASAGYQISNEKFWKAIEPFVNRLKIRGSYGALGNQNVSSYLYIASVPIGNETPWIIGGERPPYARTPRIISQSLTWEKIITANIGINAAFLNNRLDLSFDMFDRKTTDMFGPQETLPYTLGAGTPSANNAELSTKGFELILSWKDRISSDFSYHAQISLGDNKSKILKYRNESGFIDNWYDGKDIGEIWGYETDGLIQTVGETMPDQSAIYSRWGPGDMKYKDINGDGKITQGTRSLKDHGDLKVIGNRSPRYNINIAGGFNFKGFDFNMNWTGVLKRDYLPSNVSNTFYGVANVFGNSAVLKGTPVLDYWRPADETNILGPNTDAYLPKPYFSWESFKNKQDQSRYVLNAAFLRLKDIQIGYTVPTNISKKIALQKARIFISGGNLVTLKSLPEAIDPEQTIIAEDGTGYNNNGAFYPISKTYTIGVNLTF